MSSDSTPKLTPILVRPDVATCADVCAKLRVMFPDVDYDDDTTAFCACSNELVGDEIVRGHCDVCHDEGLADEKADRDYEAWRDR